MNEMSMNKTCGHMKFHADLIPHNLKKKDAYCRRDIQCVDFWSVSAVDESSHVKTAITRRNCQRESDELVASYENKHGLQGTNV